mmetsp:Transcript_4766/g.8330  ORF Transcript_4766/g.8330 Transcript_4766/m.8330 type:complete len:85 (+) Transcript_4766:247-501(+)
MSLVLLPIHAVEGDNDLGVSCTLGGEEGSLLLEEALTKISSSAMVIGLSCIREITSCRLVVECLVCKSSAEEANAFCDAPFRPR